jgi:hypothetical protein
MNADERRLNTQKLSDPNRRSSAFIGGQFCFLVSQQFEKEILCELCAL